MSHDPFTIAGVIASAGVALWMLVVVARNLRVHPPFAVITFVFGAIGALFSFGIFRLFGEHIGNASTTDGVAYAVCGFAWSAAAIAALMRTPNAELKPPRLTAAVGGAMLRAIAILLAVFSLWMLLGLYRVAEDLFTKTIDLSMVPYIAFGAVVMFVMFAAPAGLAWVLWRLADRQVRGTSLTSSLGSTPNSSGACSS